MGIFNAFAKLSTFYGIWFVLELAISIVKFVFLSKASKAYYGVFGKDPAHYNEYYKNHPMGKKAILFGRLSLIPLATMFLALIFANSAGSLPLAYGLVGFSLVAEISLEATRAVFDIIFSNSLISDINSGKLKNDRPIEEKKDEFANDFVQNEVEDAPKAKFCDECGTPVKPGSAFCEGCGKKLR